LISTAQREPGKHNHSARLPVVNSCVCVCVCVRACVRAWTVSAPRSGRACYWNGRVNPHATSVPYAPRRGPRTCTSPSSSSLLACRPGARLGLGFLFSPGGWAVSFARAAHSARVSARGSDRTAVFWPNRG